MRCPHPLGPNSSSCGYRLLAVGSSSVGGKGVSAPPLSSLPISGCDNGSVCPEVLLEGLRAGSAESRIGEVNGRAKGSVDSPRG